MGFGTIFYATGSPELDSHGKLLWYHEECPTCHGLAPNRACESNFHFLG